MRLGGEGAAWERRAALPLPPSSPPPLPLPPSMTLLLPTPGALLPLLPQAMQPAPPLRLLQQKQGRGRGRPRGVGGAVAAAAPPSHGAAGRWRPWPRRRQWVGGSGEGGSG